MGSAETSRAQSGLSCPTRLRALLVLGRVSNLPTVWSNCVAGYWIGGWGPPAVLALLCFSATLLYVGGMYLNDACDVEFDREFRPERPIIASQVARRFVLNAAMALLVCGALLLLLIDGQTFAWGCALAATIVVYDVTHKRTAPAPLLMGGCRFLLYLTAASAAALPLNPRAILCAVALALYVAGLSYLARGESTRRRILRGWPWLMLGAPIGLAFASELSLGGVVRSLPLTVCLGFAAVLLQQRQISRAVGVLLAGIVFVDLLAIASSSLGILAGFVSLFCATLLFQKYVPAT